jgi:cell division protein YceG involved in septum cleavage
MERTEEERERDRAEREQRRAERAAREGEAMHAEPAAATPDALDPGEHPEAPDAALADPPISIPPAPAPSGPPLQPVVGQIAEGAPSEPMPAPSAPVSTSASMPQQPPGDDSVAEDPTSEHAVPAAPERVAPDQARAGAEASESRLPAVPTPAASSISRVGASRAPVPRARRRPGARSVLTRALALVALAAVVAAVVLVAKSLAGSGSAKKTPVATVVRVVIPEGSTRLQSAHIAAAAGLKGSYRAASKSSTLVDPTHYGAPAGTHDLEGFLFPATYDMLPGAPVSRLVHEQLVAFRENFASGEIAQAHSLHVTPYQLLTVASMVEREAKVPGDRAKIAAVIFNRLKKGMPLGIDATIYYALEMQKGIATYTKELTEAQLQLNSPYNTRTHTGLPPTPISNPGLASIEAASKPDHVAYLYYVLAADGCGEHVFSTTLAKFEADAAAYRATVKKNGGAPPTCKK